MVVLGGARLRYGAVTPLFRTKEVHREVAVHWHYVNESLSLFLFYFLQLAVMATYVSHDLLKLVPLLAIVFVFGRSAGRTRRRGARGGVSVKRPCANVRLSLLQAHLLALPRSGLRQHQGARVRLLLPPHPGHARRQPLLRLLLSRTGSHF